MRGKSHLGSSLRLWTHPHFLAEGDTNKVLFTL